MVSAHVDALGVIFPNSYDSLVPELVTDRSMASIPFASRYRMIDFPLSSMVNAGIDNVTPFDVKFRNFKIGDLCQDFGKVLWFFILHGTSDDKFMSAKLTTKTVEQFAQGLRIGKISQRRIVTS